jgi:hypothetical protein
MAASTVETLEAFLSRETGELKRIFYEVTGVGVFERKDGKWVSLLEDSEIDFDSLVLVDLDPAKSEDLLVKFDNKEALTEADLEPYALEEEPEEL